MEIFLYIIGIIVPIITGFFIVRFLAHNYKYEGTFLEYFGLAIPIGFGLLSYSLFISNRLLSISFNFGVLLIFQIIIVLSILIYLLKIKKLSIKELLGKKIEYVENINIFKKYSKIIVIGSIGIILIQLGFMLQNILTTPTYPNDAINNRNMRSKIFFENKGLVIDENNKDFMGGGGTAIIYPLNVYMQRVWLGLSIGEWNENFVNIQAFLYFIAGLLLLFSLTYIFSKSFVYSSIASLTLASIPIFIIHGASQYGDITVSIGSIIAIIYGFLYMKNKEKFYLFVSLLGVSLAIWTKNEGLVMIYGGYCIIMLLYYIISLNKNLNKIIKKIPLLLLPLGIMVFWIIFRLKVLGFDTQDYIGQREGEQIFYISNVFKAFIENLFFQGSYNILFGAFLLVSIFNIKKILKDNIKYVYIYIIFILAALTFSPLYSSVTALNIQGMYGTGRFMISMLIGIIIFVILYLVYTYNLTEKE